MCISHQRQPGVTVVAPHRLLAILEKIGTPLPENALGPAEVTLQMLRIAYDSLRYQEGILPEGHTDYSHIKPEGEGPEYIDYVTQTYAELTGVQPGSEMLLVQLADAIASLNTLVSQEPLSAHRSQSLCSFLQTFVSTVRAQAAHHG